MSGNGGNAKTDDKWRVEEQMILRVPLEMGERLARVLNGEEAGPEGGVQLAFDEDGVPCGFRYGEGATLPARLLDLPTVTESYKTLDNKSLVKMADIGQVLVVGDPSAVGEGGGGGAVDGAGALAREHPERPGELLDGLTPATRNVRQRMFRKDHADLFSDAQFVEATRNDMKRLARGENILETVEYEPMEVSEAEALRMADGVRAVEEREEEDGEEEDDEMSSSSSSGDDDEDALDLAGEEGAALRRRQAHLRQELMALDGRLTHSQRQRMTLTNQVERMRADRAIQSLSAERARIAEELNVVSQRLAKAAAR